MLFEPNSLPIGGSALMGIVALGLISFFVAGPLVAKRTIEMDGWEARCTSNLAANIRREQSSKLPPEGFNCQAIAGRFDPSSRKLCDLVDMFTMPLEAERRHIQRLADKRIDAALEGVGSTCSCAVALTIEEERMSFAFYAGSLRVITPEPVARLHATLDSAARSPKCAFRGDGK